MLWCLSPPLRAGKIDEILMIDSDPFTLPARSSAFHVPNAFAGRQLSNFHTMEKSLIRVLPTLSAINSDQVDA